MERIRQTGEQHFQMSDICDLISYGFADLRPNEVQKTIAWLNTHHLINPYFLGKAMNKSYNIHTIPICFTTLIQRRSLVASAPIQRGLTQSLRTSTIQKCIAQNSKSWEMVLKRAAELKIDIEPLKIYLPED